MPAQATAEGTADYERRFADQVAPGHFREVRGLRVSSIGVGTYLGDPDERTDQSYRQAITAALQHGCNLIDSAINYRFQRSERVIGEVLAAAIGAGTVRREEIVIASKAGYLPFDSSAPGDPSQWFYENFVSTGVATFDDLVAGCHCMTPAYLRHQLAVSMRNLRSHSIDVYYLHNPETQLGEVTHDEFLIRLRAAFAQLEEAVAAGQIQLYGMATWNGFRQPESARDYLSLAEIVHIAEEVGGREHHFRVVQAPFNLAMPELLLRRNQQLNGEPVSLLSAAAGLGLSVVASASILQGQLSRRLPAELAQVLTGLDTDAQRAIQFVRSTPGITAALVGMRDRAHVAENLGVARVAPADREQFLKLFGGPASMQQ